MHAPPPAPAPAAPALIAAAAPQSARVAAAVRRARNSRSLWSTVNICDTPRHRGVIGVRAQMPGLGVPARLSMRFAVEYYAAAEGRFVATGVSRMLDLGYVTRGAVQRGVTFPFKAPAGGGTFQLRGVVSFSWRIGAHVVGTATRHTRNGQRGVRESDPAGYSAGLCLVRSSSAGSSTTPSGG